MTVMAGSRNVFFWINVFLVIAIVLVYHLKTAKTAEEQRLYDLRLYHALLGKGVNLLVCTADATAEELVAMREEVFRESREHFHAFEDYIQMTDLGALTDEEKAKVLRFYDLRKRIEETRDSYFDTPVEEWVALARELQSYVPDIQIILERQLEAEDSLADALRNYRTKIVHGGTRFANVSVHGLQPVSVW